VSVRDVVRTDTLQQRVQAGVARSLRVLDADELGQRRRECGGVVCRGGRGSGDRARGPSSSR
jgi:hypothetical protein